jgi:hypothetical protein
VVKDQRLGAPPHPMRDQQSTVRRRAWWSAVIAVVALVVIVVPHFLSSSPTTGEDNDPTNGVPTAPTASAGDPQRE